MANDNNNFRYGINRNLWRKTYGYGKYRPINATITDQITSQSFVYDLNQTTRHRDFFIIRESSGGDLIRDLGDFSEYDEDLIYFDFSDGTEKLFNFNFNFQRSPFVTLTVEQTNDYSNIIPYGITFSTSGAYIGISAPFSGAIRYRAIYSTQYPAYVTSAYTNSYYITAAAGTVTLTNDNEYYSSFNPLPSVPPDNFVYQTAWDPNDGTSDVYIQKYAVGTTYISSTLSAPYSKDIHYIVMSSGSNDFGQGFMYNFGFYFGD